MDDNGIELWDVQKGALLHTLKGHADQVDSMEFSPDGRRLASVGDSKDKTVRIWDVDAKSFLFSIKEKGMRVNAAAYSPNGQFIATGGYSEIRIWDAFTGGLLLKIETGNGSVYDVAYFPDGNKLASLNGNGLIHIWDVWTGRKLRTIRGYTGRIRAAAYSPDGQTIAGAGSSYIAVWDARTGALLKKLSNASSVITYRINAVAYSPDGQTIAGGAYDALIWDVKTGALLHRLDGHKDEVQTVAYSPDGQYLISGSYDKTARIWDARAGTRLHTLEGHAHIVKGAAFSPDGKNAATVSSGTLYIWDVRTGMLLKTVEPQQGSLRSVAYSPDQETIAVGTIRQVIALLDASTGALLQTYQLEKLENNTNRGDFDGITSLAFDSDGQTLAASFHETIWMWDIETGDLAHEIKGHGENCHGRRVFFGRTAAFERKLRRLHVALEPQQPSRPPLVCPPSNARMRIKRDSGRLPLFLFDKLKDAFPRRMMLNVRQNLVHLPRADERRIEMERRLPVGRRRKTERRPPYTADGSPTPPANSRPECAARLDAPQTPMPRAMCSAGSCRTGRRWRRQHPPPAPSGLRRFG